ncbi:leucine-rich repeat-containing protein 47-like [Danaus plexippus]|uniref:Leucine-rich repeat-containing protein 47 n=1 Tax=Danaus plexippus plexippus TaxID=278856 RepID=A0A212FMX7_DANPL|nr:leucine-rich repeat-containing protein 47-like [Danaus plexippus]OWR55095.1 leucine-rich repeat-containing protein 47 [Danaus plexippus plexippus]
MSVWPEVATAKSENRHEIKLAGAAISKRISEEGLDKTVFKLTNINLLNISDTCLPSIPDEIKSLVNLQSLLLYGNKLTEFNENITSLKKLKVLDLSRNQITSIPDSLNNMKELSSINFSSNKIDHMPAFGDFPNLISIDLSNNKLTDFLNTEQANLPHLTDLKIKGNEIETLPGYIASTMPSLKNFDIGENKLKTLPGEIAGMAKLKELNLKGNKLSDKRLMKLVDQCRTKQIVDYIREHCPTSDSNQATSKGKGKKAKKQDEILPDNASELSHTLKIMHLDDDTLKIKIIEQEVWNIRPYILSCIVYGLNFDEALFKKFLQMQNKLHDTVCDKRNVATLATHDMSKIPPGDLVYTAKTPSELKLIPLNRTKHFTGEQLFQQLTNEADALRKEKKRNVYSGIHKYLYLLEGKPKYPCLEDATKRVISFAPITNSEETKMTVDSKSMLVEVTSHSSLGACKTVMDKLLQECLMLGIGEGDGDFHTLTVQQVKIVDPEGNLKSIYPSRTDCVYDSTIKVYRIPKK